LLFNHFLSRKISLKNWATCLLECAREAVRENYRRNFGKALPRFFTVFAPFFHRLTPVFYRFSRFSPQQTSLRISDQPYSPPPPIEDDSPI
jgi:hypothetical protein